MINYMVSEVWQSEGPEQQRSKIVTVTVLYA